jgi:hypothetical protein
MAHTTDLVEAAAPSVDMFDGMVFHRGYACGPISQLALMADASGGNQILVPFDSTEDEAVDAFRRAWRESAETREFMAGPWETIAEYRAAKRGS